MTKTRNPHRALTQAEAARAYSRSVYRTGDGETPSASRPGSQDHQAIPSLISGMRMYRTSRKELA